MRYLLGLLIALGLIVLVFVLILKSVHGPAKQPAPLNSYAHTAAVAELSIDGPINANQNHLSLDILISQYQAQINIMTGYQGQIINSKTYPNNQPAYYAFLSALQQENFSKGNTNPALASDSGVCPQGERYEYSLTQGTKRLSQFWTSSCGGGNSAGNSAMINQLFVAQIPDYNSLTGNLPLYY